MNNFILDQLYYRRSKYSDQRTILARERVELAIKAKHLLFGKNGIMPNPRRLRKMLKIIKKGWKLQPKRVEPTEKVVKERYEFKKKDKKKRKNNRRK
jgi:hypothetical protein